jgi:glycosyltransferase involved in cell wall biosynthesis
MKLAMVSEHASPLAVVGGVDAGGQNIHVAALARELARRGVQVDVHTRRDRASLPPRVSLAPGVTVDHVDAGPPEEVPKDELLPLMGAFAEDLRRKWELNRPDVVHSHFWMSGLAALAAAEPLDIPVVHTFHALGVVKRRHQGGDDTSPADRDRVEEMIVQRAVRIVATCSDEVFELARLGADTSRVSVVPCGVDLALFAPAPNRPGRSRYRTRLLVLGRLVPRKGVEDAIAALALVPDAELVVAGGPPADALASDPEAVRLMDAAVRHGVADRVELLGRVEHERVPELLREADIAVCVPWYEPFGIVPLEAMACGIPVVVSAVGGLVDTVVHERTGLHVRPRSPESLAHALRRLIDDPALRRRFGAAGVARARSRYSWSRVAESTLAAYRAALHGGALARRGALR